jgi:membrane-associated phospholipid phosphatase
VCLILFSGGVIYIISVIYISIYLYIFYKCKMYEMEEKDESVVNNTEKNNTEKNNTEKNNTEKNKDVRSNRSVRNAEIQEKEIINENTSKNPIILSIMIWISNSVSLMFFSVFITLLVTKNNKWFYILLSVFIIVTCVEIIKIILMRYDANFLYRPGQCIGNKSVTEMLFYKNFIFEQILKKIDIPEYEKRGFPSVHMTSCVSIITMMYLFFPKYNKILLRTAPIYIILVGYSRMYLNCHTLIQVIFGIITGMLGAKLMYNVFK